MIAMCELQKEMTYGYNDTLDGNSFISTRFHAFGFLADNTLTRKLNLFTVITLMIVMTYLTSIP